MKNEAAAVAVPTPTPELDIGGAIKSEIKPEETDLGAESKAPLPVAHLQTSS